MQHLGPLQMMPSTALSKHTPHEGCDSSDSGHGAARSANCMATAYWSAQRGDVKAVTTMSPVDITSYPWCFFSSRRDTPMKASSAAE